MTKRPKLSLNTMKDLKNDAHMTVIGFHRTWLVEAWERHWQTALELNAPLGVFVSNMDYATAVWVNATSKILTDIEQTRIVRETAEKFYTDKGI